MSLSRKPVLITHGVVLALAVSAACSAKQDDTRVAAAGASAAALAGTTARAEGTSVREWFAQADSVLRRELAFLAVTEDVATSPNDLRDCDEEGSDNPPNFIAVAKARPLTYDSIASGSTDMGNVPFKYTEFRIEVSSVARLVRPDSVPSETISDSVREYTEPYEVTVSPRVDTLRISVMDYGTSRKRWSVCGAYGFVAGIESPYWGFVKNLDHDIRVVRWNPPDASWAGLRGMADSIRRASR